MEQAPTRIETERLVIRGFTPEDWRGVQELAKDLASSDAAKYDHAWPTTEEECKGAVGYFAKRTGSSWAVCLKTDKKLIGYISFNDIEKDKQLDFGHVFNTKLNRDDYDTEAIARMMDHAFTHLDIESIDCKNAEEWTVQVAPLKKLGLTVIGRGKGSFHKNPDGTPIEFTGLRMGITKEEWLRRGGKMGPVPTE